MVATVVHLAMKELHFKESFTSPMSNIFSTTKMPVKAVNFSQNGRFSAYLCTKEQENPWFRFPKFFGGNKTTNLGSSPRGLRMQFLLDVAQQLFLARQPQEVAKFSEVSR